MLLVYKYKKEDVGMKFNKLGSILFIVHTAIVFLLLLFAFLGSGYLTGNPHALEAFGYFLIIPMFFIDIVPWLISSYLSIDFNNKGFVIYHLIVGGLFYYLIGSFIELLFKKWKKRN